MTTAEQLRTEGRTEGRAEALLQQMTLKFGPLSEATAHTVRTATPEQLHTWTERILTATRLDDFLV